MLIISSYDLNNIKYTSIFKGLLHINTEIALGLK